MAQIITLPRTISFRREFEELPLFSEKDANGDLFYAGLVDGSVEISFDSTGDWHVSDIKIRVDNLRRVKDGGVARVITVDADENPALYWLLLDVLTDKYADTIDEWVAFEAEEHGLRIAA
jgi:hypothetical protein